jgi:hypothetical protein
MNSRAAARAHDTRVLPQRGASRLLVGGGQSKVPSKRLSARVSSVTPRDYPTAARSLAVGPDFPAEEAPRPALDGRFTDPTIARDPAPQAGPGSGGNRVVAPDLPQAATGRPPAGSRNKREARDEKGCFGGGARRRHRPAKLNREKGRADEVRTDRHAGQHQALAAKSKVGSRAGKRGRIR